MEGSMEQTQSEEPTNFIVHNYSRTTFLPPSSPETILDVGRQAISSARGSAGWTSVNWNFDKSIFNTHGKTFNFFQAPPILYPYEGKERSSLLPSLKDWGAPIGDTDDHSFLAVDNLPEFESTDFEYLLSFPERYPRTTLLSNESAGKNNPLATHQVTNEPGARVLSSTNYLGQPPAKRRRLYNEPLHNIIPQPHYHPSLSADYSPVDTRRIAAYAKSKPVPIPPYNTSQVQEYLTTPYVRSGWVIPVRGSLPWEHSTSALILDGSENIQPSGPGPSAVSTSKRQESCIIWTQTSITSFWNFLLAVRQAKTLGPISVSFYAAPSPNFSSVAPETTSPDAGRQAVDSSKSTAPRVFHTTLSMVDHIKIYHDTACAMHLRNALDAWGYQYRPEGNYGLQISRDDRSKAGTEVGKEPTKLLPAASAASAASAKMKKIRMLKGAILVLVDENSNGVLLS